MPRLDTLDIGLRPQKILVYGAPKVGKSKLVGDLAEHGYELYWFDCENGADVLFQLSPEAQSRVSLFSIADLKTSPEAAKTANVFMMMNNFTICHTHGAVNCVKCKAKGAEVDAFNWQEVLANPKAVIVWDSLSQLVTSIQNHITRNDQFQDFGTLNKDSKHEWGHYNAQRLFIDSFLTTVENVRCKMVVISHEIELDAEKNPNAKTVQPVGGTSVQSKSTAKYFGHVVHCRLRNNSHSTISGTTSDNSTQAGSRLNISVGKEAEGLAAIFNFKGTSVAKFSAEDSGVEVAVTANTEVKDNSKEAVSQLDAIRKKIENKSK